MFIPREAWHPEAREAFLSTEDILGRLSRRNPQARRTHHLLLRLEEAINSIDSRYGLGLDEFRMHRDSQLTHAKLVSNGDVDDERSHGITTAEALSSANNARETRANLSAGSLEENKVPSGGIWDATPQTLPTGSGTPQPFSFAELLHDCSYSFNSLTLFENSLAYLLME